MDVFVFPDYRQSNPYQTLYYEPIAARVNIRYGSLQAALRHLQRQPSDWTVFHLHWEDAIYRGLDVETAWQTAREFVATAEDFVAGGGRIVWTVHNEAPHDALHTEVHDFLVAALAKLAGRIQFHCRSAADHVARRRSIDHGKIFIAEHGNYIGYYPAWTSTQRAARARYALPENGLHLLLFGRLGAYKGAEALIDCLRRNRLPGLVAVVAGKQIDAIDADDLTASRRLIVLSGFVDDEDVAPLFSSADIVAAPYRAMLTSGTVMLAMSLGRPVLAPDLHHVSELIVHGESGVLYDPSEPGSFCRALVEAVRRDDLAELGKNARRSAETYSWQAAGKRVLASYRELFPAGLRATKANAAEAP